MKLDTPVPITSARGASRLRLTATESTAGLTPDIAVDRVLAAPESRSTPGERLVAILAATELLALIATVMIGVNLLGAPVKSVVLLASMHAGARVLRGSLRHRILLSVLEDLTSDVTAAAVAAGATLGILTVLGDTDLGVLAQIGALSFATTLAVRALTFAAVRRRRRRSERARGRALIIGAGAESLHIAHGLTTHPELGLTPVGFLTDPGPDLSATLPLLGTRMSDLGRVIAEHDITTVIATFVDDDDDLIDQMLTSTRLDTDLYVVPRLYELASNDAKTTWIAGIPIVRQTSGVTASLSWRVKRLIDIVLSALALVILAPVMLAAAAAVLLEGGDGSVLFRQRRIGLDGRSFELVKFRSMRPVDEREQQTTWNIADDPRVGPVGHILRRTSIDELPQLFNILRGDMSIVGPRPERPVFVEQFSAEHSRYWARHRFPVGLTGWAQVNGLRGDTSIAQRARFDNYYIANWSLGMDLKIILLTVREILKGSGR